MYMLILMIGANLKQSSENVISLAMAMSKWATDFGMIKDRKVVRSIGQPNKSFRLNEFQHRAQCVVSLRITWRSAKCFLHQNN